MLKMVDGSEFDVAKRTTASTKLNEDDELLIVHAMTGEETVVMQSEKEMFLRIEASSTQERKGSSRRAWHETECRRCIE